MRIASAAGVLAVFVLLQTVSREAQASWPIVTSKKPPRAAGHRIGLVAGIGSEPGFALGAQWISPVLGLQVLAGYQPTWRFLHEGRWHSLPTGIDFRSGGAVAVDALVPILRHGDTLLGIVGGYRYSSSFDDGGSGGFFVHTQGPDWFAIGVSAFLTFYEQGHCCRDVPVLSLGAPNSTGGIYAIGGEFTLALLWPRTPKERKRAPE